MVISRGAIVAAESPLTAQAGVRIPETGGNAIDAAIATNAMMGVVEPMRNGMGKDLFAIVYEAKSGKPLGPQHQIAKFFTGNNGQKESY